MNLFNYHWSPSFKLLIAVLLVGSAFNVQSASGELIVAENFDSYAAGTSLAGLDGGTGFAGAWGGSGFSTASNGSGNWTTGQSTTSTAPFPGNTRELGTDATTILSSNTGEIWLSFDFTSSSVATDTFAGLNLYEGTTERVLIGKNSNGSITNNDINWAISSDASHDGQISGVSFDTIKKGVVRFSLAAGNGGSADLWVGTVGGYVDTSGVADASIGSLTLSGIDHIAFRGNVDSTIDSIQIGTTSFDVNAVPEPTSLTLFGIGVVGLMSRRRRSR